LRLVFDTNIIISALLFDGSKPSKAFDIGIRTLLFSLPTLAELEEVLWRNKFDRYISHEERKVLANKHDIPYQSLMKMFLAERIEQELKSASR